MKRRVLAIILAISMMGGNLNTAYAAAPDRMRTENGGSSETDVSDPEETYADPADTDEPEESLPEATDEPDAAGETETGAPELNGTGAEEVTADPGETEGSVTYDDSVITAVTPPDPSEIETEYKLALESLQNRMPEILPVSLGGTVVCDTDENGDPVAVSVTGAREASIRVTSWECVQDYDEYLGEYEFTPVFAGTHTLAEGVKLPVIKVIVEKEEDGPTGYIEIPDNIEVPVVGDEILSGGLTVTPGEQPGIDGSFEAEILSTSSQAYYNGYAAGALPAIRDQGEEGACWSFASIGAVEADLIADEKVTKDNIDLSELQLAYFTSHQFDDPKDCHDGDKVTYVGSGRYLDLGGNSTIAYRALSNKVGAVKEQYAPYRRGNISLEDEYATEMDFAQIKGAYKINVTDHSGIQAAIKAHGGVAASFYATEGAGELIGKDGNGNIVSRTPYEVRYSATHNSFYGTLEKTNHAVMLVGWDDNFSKENFYDGCKPSQNGAWLVRNSWGMEEYGKSGYFWLSYYDAGLLSSGNVVAYDADTTVYDHVYTYDTQPISTTSYSSSGKIIVSQNYTVASGEKISAVGFETETANLSVTVKVTAGASSVTATKTTGFAGYYTVEFAEGLALSSKTTVTVEITMEGTGTISVPTETVTSLYYGKNNDVYYQSVCSGGGCTINGQKTTNDARIKLFTNNTTTPTPDKVIKLKKTSINDHYNTQVQMELTSDSTVTMSELTWSSVDEEIATVTADGKITVGACKGSTVVVGRHANGQTVECQVTVKPYKITWHLDSGVKVYNQLREFYPGEKDDQYWHLGYQQLYRQGYDLNGYYSAAACSPYDWVDYAALNRTFEDIDLYVGWSEIHLPVKYYAPNENLSGYDESFVYTVKEITIDDMPYTLPAADGADKNPESFVQAYNEAHPTTPKTLDGWSWDAAGTRKVTQITADTGFAMHADEAQGYGYLQNRSIVLYPQYKSGTSVVTGSCGTSVTYKLTGTQEGGYTLALTGSGNMYDEEYGVAADLPWHAYRADITVVSVGAGITGLADYSFSNCERLQTVSLPTTLKTIGERTFAGCGALTAVTLPSDLTSVGKYAWANCSGLTAITFPASLTTIGSFVLSGCTGLTQIINQSNTTIEYLPGLTGAHWINTASGSRAKITSLGKATATRVSEYCLVFDANGGDGSMSDQYCTIGTTYPVPSSSYSRTGYTFTGWNTEDDGSGDSHPVGSTIRDLGEDEDYVYLYAQWRARSYKVTFDANAQGATVSPSNKNVTYEGLYGELPVPVRSGYTSDGWFTAATGGTQVVAATTVKAAANHTLYAHWKGDRHTVTFNANGGSGGTTKSYTNGSTYGTLPTTFKTGYDFDGWYTAETGGTRIESTATVLLLSDVTYYAHWTAKTYTVTFHPNGTGATVSPTSKTVTYDQPYGDLPEPQFAGCDFAGWYTGASTGTLVGADTLCKLTADQTLYARWTGKTYTVTFDTGTDEVTASPATISVTYGAAYPALPTLSGRTGYSFDGWYKAETGGTKIDSSTKVTQTQDHTIYARWNPISYQVNFDANGGNVSESSRQVAYDSAYGAGRSLPVPTWSGHGFLGWFTQSEDGTAVTDTTICRTAAEHTLYAHWGADNYIVSFEVSGGTTVDPILVTNGQPYGTLPVTSRTGYTFEGWYTSASGNTQVTEETLVTATAAHTLHAHWTANTYKIRYDANGGSGSMDIDTDATYDRNVSLQTNKYTKTGYTFTGWNTAADGSGDAYTDRQSVMNLTAVSEEIVILYAQWKINAYTIVYDANGGTGTMEDTPATYNEDVTLRTNAYTKTGHTFAGWNTYSTGSGTSYEDGDTVRNLKETGTVTLYAQWTANTYTIRYDANGGTGTMADTAATYGVLVTLRANSYTKPGHGFIGWNTEADGTGTPYENEKRVSNLTADDGATVILYAQWSNYSYMIRYDVNGGTGSMEDTSADCDENVTLRTNTYTRTGYLYSGWNTEPDGSGTAYADEAVVNNLSIENGATVTLYAQWTAINYRISYEANGADGAMAPTTAAYDTDVALRTISFTKTGYHFVGWNTQADGNGTPYGNGFSTEGEIFVRNLTSEQGGVVTLYAQWDKNSYMIQYDKNGASGGNMSDTEALYDVDVRLRKNTFRRTGYQFTGWNTGRRGTGTGYADQAYVRNLTDVENGEVTLYAQWIANTYTIKYDANGGSNTMEDTAATYDVPVALPENAFTREGYRFTGWQYTVSGRVQTCADKAVVSNLTNENNGEVILYAQWTAETYQLSFDAQGGTPAPDARTVTYDTAYGELPAATKTGYRLIGWFTLAEGGTQVTSTTICKTASDHTLYAHWEEPEYRLTYDANGGTAVDGDGNELTEEQLVRIIHYWDAYGQLPGAVRPGYAFGGWYTQATGGEEVTADLQYLCEQDKTIYAHWSAIAYQVRYDANGGTGTMADSDAVYDTELTLRTARFSKAGHVFMGWNTRADGTGTPYADGASVRNLTETAGDIVILYARWERIYTLVLDLQGGSLDQMDSVVFRIQPGKSVREVLTEQGVTTVNDPVRTKYTFAGWYTAATGGSKLDDDWFEVTTLHDDMTIYAHWQPVYQEQTPAPVIMVADDPTAAAGSTIPATARIAIRTNTAQDQDAGITRIYYTTDGSDPMVSVTRKLYTGELTAGDIAGIVTPGDTDRQVTLKAYAVREGRMDSAVAEAAYVLRNETTYWGDVQEAADRALWQSADKVTGGLWIGAIGDQIFTGSAITFSSDDLRVYDGKKLLTAGTDYTVAYKNNKEIYAIAAGTAGFNAAKAPTVTVTGKGNYSGSVARTFIIRKADGVNENATLLSKATVTMDKSVAYDAEQAAAADGITLTNLTLKKNGADLVKDTDYTVSYINNRNAGTATVILTGTGNYYGEVRKTFTINGTALTKCFIDGFDTGADIYDGTPKTKAVTIWPDRNKQAGSELHEAWKDDNHAYRRNENGCYVDGDGNISGDYVIAYEKNTDAGTATMILTGIGNYTGSVKKTWRITAYDLSKDNAGRIKVYSSKNGSAAPADWEEWSDNNRPEYAYTKGGVKPEPIVIFVKASENNVPASWIPLDAGKDYTMTWTSNTTVNDGSDDRKLPTIKITGKGNFSGIRQEEHFTIAGRSLSATDDAGRPVITVAAGDVTYVNKVKNYIPAFKIYDTNGTALAASDYEAKSAKYYYAEDTDLADGKTRQGGTEIPVDDIVPAGTLLRMTVDAKNDGRCPYTGTAEGYYRIVEGDLAKAAVKIPNQFYTGREIRLNKQDLTVTLAGRNLSPEDYEIVSYDNNKNKGSAKVTIRGLGNYGGTKTAPFTIAARLMNTTIRYNGNGAASGSMADLRVTKLTGNLANNAYKRPGYVFAGWSTRADITAEIAGEWELQEDGARTRGGDFYYATDGTAARPVPVRGVLLYSDALQAAGTAQESLKNGEGSLITLYADWEPVVYHVRWHTNGGLNHPLNTAAGYTADTPTFTLYAPNRSDWPVGYQFGGWYRDSAYKNRISEVKQGSTGDLDLWAKWVPYTYQVHFDGNGATNDAKGDLMPDEGFSYGVPKALTANKYKKSVQDPADARKKIDYVFLGWSLTRIDPAAAGAADQIAAATIYSDKQSITEADLGLGVKNHGRERKTLYAVWSNEFRIAYDFSGGAEKAGDHYGTMYSYGRTWSADGNAYNLPYRLPMPERAGYTFAGWYDAAGKKVTQIAKNTSGDQYLTASWTPYTYSIKYDGNGKTGGAMAVQKMTYGQAGRLLSNAYTRKNMEFLGWSTIRRDPADEQDVEFRNAADFDESDFAAKLTGNNKTITLYACWKAPEAGTRYSLTYHLFDDEVLPGDHTYPFGTGIAAEVMPVPADRAGCTFDGWYRDDTLKTKVTSVATTEAGDLDLYAKWKGKAYTLRYTADAPAAGVTGRMAYQKMTYLTAKALTGNAFKLKGYTFLGWSTESAAHAEEDGRAPAERAIVCTDKAVVTGDGLIYNNGRAIDPAPGNVNGGTVTLYGVWQRTEYTISYFNADGVDNEANPLTYNIDSDEIVLVEPALMGNTFLGWYSDKTLRKQVKTIPAGSTGDITLYAKWMTHHYTICYDLNDGEDSPAVLDTSRAGYVTNYLRNGESGYVLPTATRKGYTFVGWYKEKTCRTPVGPIIATPDVDMTVYAKWLVP